MFRSIYPLTVNENVFFKYMGKVISIIITFNYYTYFSKKNGEEWFSVAYISISCIFIAFEILIIKAFDTLGIF